MRHQELRNNDTFDIVELAEIWPERAAELEADRKPVMGTTSVPDMPAAAGALLVAVYGALMAAFALTMADAGPAGFAIVISLFFVVMFFAVPTTFLRVEQDGSRRPTLAAFLERGIDTPNGRVSGVGALVQMLIVPGLLTLAVLAIGVINLVI